MTLLSFYLLLQRRAFQFLEQGMLACCPFCCKPHVSAILSAWKPLLPHWMTSSLSITAQIFISSPLVPALCINELGQVFVRLLLQDSRNLCLIYCRTQNLCPICCDYISLFIPLREYKIRGLMADLRILIQENFPQLHQHCLLPSSICGWLLLLKFQ